LGGECNRLRRLHLILCLRSFNPYPLGRLTVIRAARRGELGSRSEPATFLFSAEADLFRWLGLAFYRLISDVGHSHGFELIGTDVASPEEMQVLEDALSLIDERAPWILEHARRDLGRLIVREPGAPTHGGWLGVIWVPTDWLGRYSAEWLSTALVYAMTFARIRSALGRLPKRLRFRAFRISYERQIRFARRLPDPFEILEALTHAWDSGWYSTEPQIRESAEQLKRLGSPLWVIRLFAALRRRRGW